MLQTSANALRDKLRDCNSLPSLPAAAMAVLQLTQREGAGVNELADIISKDPALSSKVLRTVNSSFYGLSQKVSSIQQAVALLGMHTVKTLVLGFSLVSGMRAQQKIGFDYLSYWRRSMYAAAAARVLASRLCPQRTEDAFVAALLMDLGTLVLDQLLGDQYSALYERAESHSDLLIIETHSLGMTHAEVSGILAEHWRLPEVLKVPMAAHHGGISVDDPDLKHISDVISLSGRCADVFVSPSAAQSISTIRRLLLESYKIPEMQSDALMCEISQKTSQLAPLFEVRLQSNADYESILAKASERLLEISLAERECQSDKNRRRANRVRRDGKVLVIPCCQGIMGKSSQVRLKDLSASGIGIIHSDSMDAGQQFIIQLPQPGGSIKSLLYTVRRVDAAGGLYSIGAELTSVLRPDQVKPDAAVA